jgi:hypothetical protein
MLGLRLSEHDNGNAVPDLLAWVRWRVRASVADGEVSLKAEILELNVA